MTFTSFFSQGASAPSNKSWELYLEILVPTDLVDVESNTGLSFQPLVENLTFWCQCIHLCRGISKQSAPSLPSSPPSGDTMVIIVPQRGSNGDNASPEPLVLSSNKNDDLEIPPIRLQLLCKPPIITPSDPIIVVGVICSIMDWYQSVNYDPFFPKPSLLAALNYPSMH